MTERYEPRQTEIQDTILKKVMLHQSDEEIRSLICQALRRREIPDPIWKYLKEKHFISYIQDGNTRDDARENFKDTVNETESLLQLRDEMAELDAPLNRFRYSHSEREDNEIENVDQLKSHERTHSIAMAGYFAALAANDMAMEVFRSEVLGGNLLTVEKAYEFCHSPAYQYFSLDELLDIGFILGKDTAALLEEESSYQAGISIEKLTIGFAPSGIQKTVERSGLYDQFGDRITVHGTGTGVERVLFWKGSVMDSLARISRHLAKRFHWSEKEAVQFVLTDVIPSYRTIASGVIDLADPYGMFLDGYITMTIAPWVSPDTVKQTYQSARKKVFGREYHRQSARSFELFQFVTRNIGPDGKVRLTSELHKEWNRLHPKNRIQHLSNFLRDYNRAKKRLVLPKYRHNYLEI